MTALTIFCAASSRSSAGITLQAGFGEDRLALLDVVAFEPDDERHFQAVSFTAATMPVAMTLQSMMPPKMFTRMPFTFGSAEMILNAAVTCSLLAPPPTSRKFAGPAEMLDDVHRRHREARAVDEAGDAAVELDVIELNLLASISSGASSFRSRISRMSLWR